MRKPNAMCYKPVFFPGLHTQLMDRDIKFIFNELIQTIQTHAESFPTQVYNGKITTLCKTINTHPEMVVNRSKVLKLNLNVFCVSAISVL